MNKYNIIILLFLIPYFSLNAQKVYEIYEDDPIDNYIDKNKPITSFRKTDNIKDSLEDGIYLFYNVSRKDSLSQFKKVKFKAEYLNGFKNGSFETYDYFYYQEREEIELRYRHICDYKNGKKHGVEEISYISHYASKLYLVSTNLYAEYINGKRDGLFIYSYNGIIESVEVYENGELKKVLLKRENLELKELLE